MQFINTIFKVAPPPRLSVHAILLVSHAYLTPSCYVFIESHTSHAARCYWLGAKSPEKSQTQQNKKIQTEGRVSVDTDTTTHL